MAVKTTWITGGASQFKGQDPLSYALEAAAQCLRVYGAVDFATGTAPLNLGAAEWQIQGGTKSTTFTQVVQTTGTVTFPNAFKVGVLFCFGSATPFPLTVSSITLSTVTFRVYNDPATFTANCHWVAMGY